MKHLSLYEILTHLRAPVDRERISQKSTGSFRASYLHHKDVRELLDERAPGWESTTRITDAGGQLFVTVALTIHGSDGSLTRENIGCEKDSLGDKDFGDSSSNSHAQALRRAAMEFGLGRDLWLAPREKGAAKKGAAKKAQRRHPARTNRPMPVDADDYR